MQVFKGLKLKTVLPIALFAALMTWLLLFVLAAGPFVSIETESASISGNVEVKTDSNASAGSYLSFGTTSTGGGGSGGGGTGGSSGDAGLIRPIGPQSLSCSSISGSVDISPGTNIQSIVDSKPTGTTFCLKAGTHKRQSIQPKGNDTFVGEKGAILDGERATTYAFYGGGANGVTVKNLIIENYMPEMQKAMIEPTSVSKWNIENNEIRNSNAIGTAVGGKAWKVVNNYIHHNEQYGMEGAPYTFEGRDPIIENNEISFNRLNAKYVGGSSGALKFVVSNNLKFRHNWIHDNNGNGFWVDGNNINTLIEYNLIEKNAQSGIFIEISCDTTIRYNVARDNGLKSKYWHSTSAVEVNSSANVEIYENTFVNTGGVAGIDWNRKNINNKCETTSPGLFQTRDMWVHDNYFESNRYQFGGLGGSASNSDRNNKFDRNTYVPKGIKEPLYKLGTDATTAQWKAAGQDKNSIWR
jgi:hypothetical protein